MQITESQKWFFFAGILFTGWMIYLLAPILTPFVAAFILAYLGKPLVDYLVAHKRSRLLSVTLVFILLILFFLFITLLFLPSLENQLNRLFLRLPEIITWFKENILSSLVVSLGAEEGMNGKQILQLALIQHWQQAGGILSILLSWISSSTMGLLLWITNMVLIPVVTFYLLLDWHLIMEYIHALIPRRYEQKVTQLAQECDVMLAEFLRGQLFVMGGLSIIYVTGLWLIDVEFSLLLGLISGVVSFIPYLGLIVGIGLSGTMAYFQFQELLPVFLVIGVFGFAQIVETVWLTPWFVGNKIGLHPVVVMFAVMAGGQLFGFFGILLALPVAAVLVVILRHLHEQYVNSHLYLP